MRPGHARINRRVADDPAAEADDPAADVPVVADVPAVAEDRVEKEEEAAISID